MRKKTKVIAGSVMTMALCASLIAGSTFALFSSRSEVNLAITSGELKVTATAEEIKGISTVYDEASRDFIEQEAGSGKTGSFETKGTWTWNEAEGKIQLDKIAPGDGIEFDLEIENESNISIKYRSEVTIVKRGNENAAEKNPLANVLKVTFGKEGEESSTVVGTSTVIAQKWSEPIKPDAGDTIPSQHVKVMFPYSNEDQNEFQEQEVEIRIGVYAVQSNAHVVDAEGALVIYNTVDFSNFAASVTAGNDYAGQTVALGGDVDLSKEDIATFMPHLVAFAETPKWTPIGDSDHAFKGTFEGNNYTISGLTCEGETAALFGATDGATIQNVKIAGANVTATEGGTAGVLVANAKGELTLSNIVVEDSIVKAAENVDATVGALVGTADGTVTASGVDVQVNEADSELCEGNVQDALVGSGTVEYEGENNELRCEPTEGFAEVVKLGDVSTTSYEISSLNGFKYFAKTVNGDEELSLAAKTYQGSTVYLTANIDLKNEEWTPIGNNKSGTLFQGTFDGKDRTISNLTIKNVADGVGAGLFNSTENAQYKNLVLRNVNIEGKEYVGSLVGYGYTSDYTNISVYNATLKGNHYMGGIAGGSYSSAINCHVDGLTIECTPNVSGDTFDNGDKVGGLIGIAESGTFNYESCSVKNATISAYRDVGGFVGYANNGHVKNSELENVHIIVDRTNFYEDKEVNADSYIGRKGNDCTVDEASKEAVKDFSIDYLPAPKDIEAVEGTAYSDVVKETLKSANSGSTFKLTEDVDIQTKEPGGRGKDNRITQKGITLNMQNHSITLHANKENFKIGQTHEGVGIWSGEDYFPAHEAIGASVVFENGTFISDNVTTLFRVEGPSSLIFRNVTFKLLNNTGSSVVAQVYPDSQCGMAKYGCKYNCNEGTVTENVTIKFEGCTFENVTAVNYDIHSGNNVLKSMETVFEGCTFNMTSAGKVMSFNAVTGGNVKINHCNFNFSGSVASGMKCISFGTYTTGVTCDITGCKFTYAGDVNARSAAIVDFYTFGEGNTLNYKDITIVSPNGGQLPVASESKNNTVNALNEVTYSKSDAE